MMRVLLCAGLWSMSAAAWADFSSSTLKGVDVYRTDQITADQFQEKLGPLLTAYVRLRYEGHKSRLKETARLKAQIESEAKAMGKFAFVDLYYGEYVTSADRMVYLTLDAVDGADAAARMPFRAAPAGHPADPGGLVAAWRQYYQTGLTLSGQGILSQEDQPTCPGFYCRWGSSTPELAALESKLARGAEPQKAALKTFAREEADPSLRADALFALSYCADGNEVAQIMNEALGDPSPEPRAAALQILSDIAIYHKSILIDIARVIAVLDYPTVTDRSKALGMLVALADSPSYRTYILSRGVSKLLPLLKLEQPSNHDMAFTLLSVLSQASFGPRDYDAWAGWIDNQSSTATATAPPPKKKHRW